jgi:hypothetical protein
VTDLQRELAQPIPSPEMQALVRFYADVTWTGASEPDAAPRRNARTASIERD